MTARRVDMYALRAALARSSPRRSRFRASSARAAVAAVLRGTPHGPELLLVRRAHREGDRWSGHWALPGGLAHPDDALPYETARRETREEIGVDLAEAGLLIGELSDVVTLAHRGRRLLVVTPFVVELVRPIAPSSSREIDECRWVPLSELVEQRRDLGRAQRVLGWIWPRRGVMLGGRPLWGLTLAMIDELVSIVTSPVHGKMPLN